MNLADWNEISWKKSDKNRKTHKYNHCSAESLQASWRNSDSKQEKKKKRFVNCPAKQRLSGPLHIIEETSLPLS